MASADSTSEKAITRGESRGTRTVQDATELRKRDGKAISGHRSHRSISHQFDSFIGPIVE